MNINQFIDFLYEIGFSIKQDVLVDNKFREIKSKPFPESLIWGHEIDKILSKICPDISYLKYRDLTRALFGVPVLFDDKSFSTVQKIFNAFHKVGIITLKVNQIPIDKIHVGMVIRSSDKKLTGVVHRTDNFYEPFWWVKFSNGNEGGFYKNNYDCEVLYCKGLIDIR